jgi:hypothetical protein
MVFTRLTLFLLLVACSGVFSQFEDNGSGDDDDAPDCECSVITLRDGNSGEIDFDPDWFLFCTFYYTGTNIGNCLTAFRGKFWCYVSSTR